MMKNDILQDLTNITTLNKENIIDIITSGKENDYVQSWRARISEEINTRIETGVVTPIGCLSWCIRGIGWETLQSITPF